MSEAMTNREIEDVLASVRRLVAQGARRAEPRSAELRALPERFLLTEEYRIRQANLTEAPEPRPETCLESQTDLRPELRPEAAPPEPAHPALAAAVAAVLRESAPGDEPQTAQDSAPGHAAMNAPQRAAVAVPPPIDRSVLEATIREIEASLPPGPEVPPAAAPEAAPPRTSPPPRSSAPPQPAAELVGDDVAFIDEEDLQLMVAKLVREELRGQLGERITLQVRKLVRAEIARVLDERNLFG